MGIVGGGAYAERIAVHERQLMAVPDSVTLADAAAIPEVWITAFDALVVQGGLTSGRTALVHAGASGVGTAAIQIARAIGARIIVTASAGKVDRCLALGADRVVDYGSEDFVAATRELTDGAGADVILDVVGGDYVDRNLDAVALRGRIVQVGTMAGGDTQVNVGKLMARRAALIGTMLRSRPWRRRWPSPDCSPPRSCPGSIAMACTRSSTVATRSARSRTPTGPWRPTRTWARSSSTSPRPERRSGPEFPGP